jgi:3-methyladenine DNA glycosylase/8-oxoguanine DNA glycosylase
VHEVTFTPSGPYRLDASSGVPDPTRRRRGGLLSLAFNAGSEPARARIWQTGDGLIHARIASSSRPDAAHDRLRRILRLDADHRPFHELARRDPLLRRLWPRLRAVRPMMLATPEHALVKAVAGQLIRGSEAWKIECRIIRLTCATDGELWSPPTAAELTAVHGARFARAGLSSARASLLHRSARRLPWQSLADAGTDEALARIRQEPGLGPWSAGVVMLYGYGRDDAALVDDLGLVKLARALGLETTEELVAPYGEWRGLASYWLLRHPAANDRAAAARMPRFRQANS